MAEPTQGAPPVAGNDAPATPPATPPAAPKFELKDGKMLVDGKKVVYEHELIAAKESLQKRLEEAQGVHSQAADTLKLEISNAQTELAKANARIQELSKAGSSGAASAEEVAKLKKEADDARAAAKSASESLLEIRRQAIIQASRGTITAEQLKGKSDADLAAFEAVLKALGNSRGGLGPYAVPGGGATTDMTPMDRAKKLLEATPMVGTRNVPGNP
ncbi:MAG: hypothetical protein PHQ43_07395 [Dehalococcoidales bacterium]|nr:hypothetical protein [Dehalococcoidales bacterium]